MAGSKPAVNAIPSVINMISADIGPPIASERSEDISLNRTEHTKYYKRAH